MNEDLKQIRMGIAKLVEALEKLVAKGDVRYDRRADAKPIRTKTPVMSQQDDKERSGPFRMRSAEAVRSELDAVTHVYGDGIVCRTQSRGFPTPGNRSITDLRVDSRRGFVPLWKKGTILNWRFNENSMLAFDRPDAAKDAIQALFSDAISRWGDACPVRFRKQDEAWDFEFVMIHVNDCDSSGRCVLAEAFLPNSGQNQIKLFPKLFLQELDEEVRVNTLIHELGHVFGLRHWFANTQEADSPSELFGANSHYSIMNYGSEMILTDADTEDLTRLYEEVWSGARTNVNGTPIHLFGPFHSEGVPASAAVFNSFSSARRCNCHQ